MAHEVMISSEVIQILFDDTEFIYQDWWARNNSYLKKKTISDLLNYYDELSQTRSSRNSVVSLEQ